ncbi:hypothetical protein E2C01_085700 [Portunus trituberculatus]|uniref:Uncharacterized protein n=1 Tax=Portunus trituberculatus TaxID=210409 RepID=A0A5B7J8A1_PORTR|nr:hypothetical protein [Portunus trituberculatus]
MNKRHSIDIEEILIHQDHFGLYSIWVFCLSCVVAWMNGCFFTRDSFVAYLNPHRDILGDLRLSLDSTHLRTYLTTLDVQNTSQGWFLEECFV